VFVRVFLGGVGWAIGNVGVYASECLALIYLGLSYQRLRSNSAARILSVLALALFLMTFLVSPTLLSMAFTMRLVAGIFLVLALSQETFELGEIWVLSLAIPAIVALIALVSGQAESDSMLGIALHNPTDHGTAVIEYLRNGELIRQWRSYATFPHPNIFGGFLVVWFMVVALTRSRVSIFLLALSGFLLASTFSREAILAAVVFSAIYFFQRPQLSKLIAFWSGLTLGLLNWLPAYGARMGLTPSRLEEASLTGRLSGFENARMILVKHPWFGVGLMQTAPALAVLANNGQPFWAYEIPHLVPLLLLTELGLLGTFVLVVAVTILLKRAWCRELWPLCAGLVVLALFDHFLVTSAQFILIEALALGTVAACGNNQKHN